MRSLILTIACFCIATITHAQFTPNTSSLSTTIERNGHIKIDDSGFGLIFGGAGDNDRSDWYGQWYGLTRGRALDMSFSNVGNEDPILLQGFSGLGFRTADGKMAFMRNGMLVIGGDLSKAEFDNIRNFNPSNQYKVYIQGGVVAEEVKVQLRGDWADYVFEDDYELPKLEEVEKAIQQEGKLPDFPSAATVKEEGLIMGKITTLQQEKIEELFLYMIEMQKEVKACHEEIANLKSQLNK